MRYKKRLNKKRSAFSFSIKDKIFLFTYKIICDIII